MKIAITATSEEEFASIKERINMLSEIFLERFQSAYKNSLSGEIVLLSDKPIEPELTLPANFMLNYMEVSPKTEIRKQDEEFTEKVTNHVYVYGRVKDKPIKLIFSDVNIAKFKMRVQYEG